MCYNEPNVKDRAKAMSALDDVTKHREQILMLAEKNGCCNVRLFGSVLRGEERPDSDIDFLVDIEKGRSILDLVGFQLDVQDMFERKIDVVPAKGLHWFIKKAVLEEARLI